MSQMVLHNLKENTLRLTRQHKIDEKPVDNSSNFENPFDFNGFIRSLALNDAGRRLSYTPAPQMLPTRERDQARTFSYKPNGLDKK